ncbi:MAG: hypothetical protein CMN28_03745 [Salinisphaeraceae bacterium]|jgi:uncharacterized membrane protein|nr:hypothetical protein [Salinisphaeraceae bacterium]
MLLTKLKTALILLACVAGAWLAVIAFWRLSGRDPGTPEILGLLLAAPLACGLIWLALTHLFTRLQRDAAADEANARAQSLPADDAANTFTVIAASVLLPAGHDPDAVLAILEADATRPGLTEQLTDARGFPVFAAPCPALPDTLDQPVELPDLPPPDQGEWRLTERRSLAAAAAALDDLTRRMAAQDSAEPPAAEQAIGLSVGLPAGWPDARRTLACEWIETRLRGQSTAVQRVQLLPAGDPASTLAAIQGLGRTDESETPLPDRWLVVAADSALCQDTVTRWDESNQMFHQGHPRGLVPAEGAAALCLIPGARTDFPNYATLQLIESTLDTETAGTAPAARAELKDVQLVCTDAQLLPEQLLQTERALNRLSDATDTVPPALHLGITCGHTGAATTLAVLGLAAHAAQRGRKTLSLLGAAGPAALQAAVASPAAASRQNEAAAEPTA